ncbi:MAG TPA: EAL domain-containing protein, partial [Nitrosospira sp.]|nr:EAL domain-containing protein [Nitrosospira sp.]
VNAVINLAHVLDLTVVAEGVETDGQQQVLRGLGCDELQGFLVAKPMPANTLSIWMSRREMIEPGELPSELSSADLKQAAFGAL